MQYDQQRRKAIKILGGLMALGISGLALPPKKKKAPLLSFSTLGCPDWSFQQIVDFAVTHQFNGLELRGIQRQMDLTKCSVFSPENIRDTLRLMKDNNLHFVDLGSSASLHHEPGPERTKSLDEAKRFIDLAQKINCPYIRVFPDKLPKEKEKAAVLDLIINGLTELGNYANGSKVTVLMETHGDVVKTEDILKIMTTVNHKKTALIWDVVNMWEVTKEPVADVYKALKPYIKHVHVKDAKIENGKLAYTLIGQGETPIFEALDILHADGFKGYYSLEWEKLWHPEIAEPEIAIAAYSKTMRERFHMSYPY